MNDDLSMKMNEKTIKIVFTMEYFLKYGYFSFKRSKSNDEENLEEEDEYQTTVSDMFSNKIWTMEEINDFIKRNTNFEKEIVNELLDKKK